MSQKASEEMRCCITSTIAQRNDPLHCHRREALPQTADAVGAGHVLASPGREQGKSVAVI